MLATHQVQYPVESESYLTRTLLHLQPKPIQVIIIVNIVRIKTTIGKRICGNG